MKSLIFQKKKKKGHFITLDCKTQAHYQTCGTLDIDAREGDQDGQLCEGLNIEALKSAHDRHDGDVST
jgi:hypothetical protein